MPPQIRTLIGSLGLRYEPSRQADLQAHGARIALLSEDMAEANPDLLARAIERWVHVKPYLPKASELHAIIEDMQAAQAPGAFCDLERMVEDGNREARAKGMDWFFRIAVRHMPDGSRQRYVERLEGWRAEEARRTDAGERSGYWKPEPGEVEDINIRVSRFVSEGWSQHEFNEHVRRTGGNI
ncbi:hypothetical protein GCM10011349_20150 [Novosphingobium indicum]|uniref:Uncharacterized protein n=1 Tax=Novosphingobium indicum TaxID=462949 RepID=A0ABQ2JM33_9SPHN|nr:hypothetical protein GCM10011349_20150 [Novosphingobium indicum]